MLDSQSSSSWCEFYHLIRSQQSLDKRVLDYLTFPPDCIVCVFIEDVKLLKQKRKNSSLKSYLQ